jgi:hypothetical protein
MPPRRRPQSVRGIVRDHLELIERNRQIGIAQWATLEQLGLKDVSLPSFRDALYRARRRLRSPRGAGKAAPHPPGSISVRVNASVDTGVTAPPKDTPLLPPRPSRDAEGTRSMKQMRTTDTHGMNTHRDFLDLVRTTPDKDIF